MCTATPEGPWRVPPDACDPPTVPSSPVGRFVPDEVSPVLSSNLRAFEAGESSRGTWPTCASSPGPADSDRRAGGVPALGSVPAGTAASDVIGIPAEMVGPWKGAGRTPPCEERCVCSEHRTQASSPGAAEPRRRRRKPRERQARRGDARPFPHSRPAVVLSSGSRGSLRVALLNLLLEPQIYTRHAWYMQGRVQQRRRVGMLGSRVGVTAASNKMTPQPENPNFHLCRCSYKRKNRVL